MNKVIIFSENQGWHEQHLIQALAKHNTEAVVVSLGDCLLGSGDNRSGLQIPGFSRQLPVAAIVRAIPAGTFEEVTFRLDVLHALQDTGVLVINTAKSIERTVDKGMTSFLLNHAGIPTPDTWVCESVTDVRKIFNHQFNTGMKLVLKPLFGNCGRGLLMIESPDDLPAAEEIGGVYYLQTYIRTPDNSHRDWRVFVAGDKAVAAMERVSNHWITNRARGAKCLPAVLTDELGNLAVSAALACGTGYAGVDIIMDEHNRYQVLEVNSVPAWRGLQSVSPVNIADCLVNELMSQLSAKQQETAVG